jgi:NADPH-dependent curcumin reductase
VRGFINNEFAAEYYPAFLHEVAAGIADGRIRYREDFVDGLENAPEAFIGIAGRAQFWQADRASGRINARRERRT